MNGNRYIGVTSKSKEERWKDHQWRASKGAKSYFHCAIRKYGAGAFILETLEEGLDSEIGKNIKEPHWIAALKPEYNMTPGGDGTGAGELSAKYGTKLQPETKEKIRKARIGSKASEETRMKMSKTHTGMRVGEKNPMWGLKGFNSPNFGSKRTLETRERMRIAQQLIQLRKKEK